MKMTIKRPSEAFQNLADGYRSAREAGKIPFWIVFLIAIYIPFEDFIIKWIPISESGRGVLRYIPELVLYGLMFKVLGDRFFKTQNLKATPIDLLLLIFFISATISITLNECDLLTSALTLRILWRYLSVFYIVVNIEISVEQLALVLKSIKVVGLIQGGLSSLQYFMPESFRQIFAPRGFQIGDYEKTSAAEEGLNKAGAISGTFDQPDVLGSFLLLVFCLSLGLFCSSMFRELVSKLKEVVEISVLLFGIFASKKRIVLFLALISTFLVLFFQNRVRGLLKLGWFYAVLGLIISLLIAYFGAQVDTSFSGIQSREETVDLSSYFLQIFSPDYYGHSSENARGWIIETIVPAIFKSGSWFGFGPDLENMRHAIFDLLVDGRDRAYLFEFDYYEDVYWVAMLGYYGPVGLGIYGLIIWRLLQTGRLIIKSLTQPEYKALGSVFCSLVGILLIYNFVSRPMLLRPFGFCFWLFAGLVVNVYNRHYFQKNLSEDNTSVD